MSGSPSGSRNYVRASIVVAVVLSSVVVASDVGLLSSSDDVQLGEYPTELAANELDGATIISSQSGSIYVASPNGTVLARVSEHDEYFDVDVVDSMGAATVLYTAVDTIPKGDCPKTTKCKRNTVGTYNLTTGESETLFAQTIPAETAPQWHDADHVRANRFVVADMSRDRVFVVNASSGLIEWQWQAQQSFHLSSGDESFQDWTHLNDVEVLPDGRIMVSARNQDRVVFVDRETGMNASQTLGEEEEAGDREKILYEQHNPDYIHEREGGPAVLVADSEQNRVVEFRRRGDSWNESWAYSRGLDWPRDADRLPNGHTLITDSRNRRVLEIDQRNRIVWEMDIPLPYDAERIGTGPESRGGPSATKLNLAPASGSSTQRTAMERIEGALPDVVVHPVAFVLSKYPISVTGLLALLSTVSLCGLWGALEWKWSRYSLQNPVQREE